MVTLSNSVNSSIESIAHFTRNNIFTAQSHNKNASSHIADQLIQESATFQPIAFINGSEIALNKIEFINNQVVATFDGNYVIKYQAETSLGFDLYSKISNSIKSELDLTLYNTSGLPKSVAIFHADPINGGINYNGKILLPGYDGYTQAAIDLSKSEGHFIDKSAMPSFGKTVTLKNFIDDTSSNYGVIFLPNDDTTKAVSNFFHVNNNDSAELSVLKQDTYSTIISLTGENKVSPSPNSPVDLVMKFTPTVGFNTQAQSISSQSDDVFIKSLYTDVLGRAADASGLTFWQSILKTGLGREAIVSNFANSAEYIATKIEGAATSEFLDNVYSDVLGRAGDASGLAYWASLIDRGVSRVEVVGAFLNSAEHHTQF